MPNELTAPLPLPELPMRIRPGTMADIPFMDALQKKQTRQVGWMPTKQFEGKIKAGHVLIAEESGEQRRKAEDVRRKGENAEASDGASLSSLPPSALPLTPPERLGYLIGNDQYFKRDDLGIIYQINVAPGKRRGLIGASLLKAQFERSAYGCNLYCCWCAQDIEANRFWEAMGFVALAYRVGSKTRGVRGKAEGVRESAEGRSSLTPYASRLTSLSPRVHIFWQKRIRANDVSTPFWFPSKTSGGSIREDRIVLPIPTGVHWSESQTLVLPTTGRNEELLELTGAETTARPARTRKKKTTTTETTPTTTTPVARKQTVVQCGGGLMFARKITQTATTTIEQPARPEMKPELALAKPAKPKRTKAPIDTRLIDAARELRDRWLEQVDETTLSGTEKYAVCRLVGNGDKLLLPAHGTACIEGQVVREIAA